MESIETQQQFIDLSEKYFNGILSVTDLINRLEKFVTIKAEEIDISPAKRIMFISNHPNADHTLTVPATNISGLKGGNTRNFPSFWFPIIRQALLYKALNRRFVTIANDIGWPVAMQELWHFPITHIPGGRCKFIIDSLSKDTDCSVVIFPEGRASDLTEFHKGFLYIAKELGIDTLVTGKITPTLSLNTENSLEILRIENIGNLFDPIDQFISQKQAMLREAC